MDLDVVRYEVDDGIGLITLNRPDRLNAWTKQMQLQYRFCMATADADPLVKVIVVTGAGRGFCAGIDFDDLAGGGAVDNASVDMADSEIVEPKPGAGVRPDFDHVHSFHLGLHKPVIAAVNGPAAGA